MLTILIEVLSLVTLVLLTVIPEPISIIERQLPYIKEDSNIQNSSAIIQKLEEIHVPPYGSNSCETYEPKMPDFRAPGRRISEVKCFEYVWKMKFQQQEADRYYECFIKHQRTRLIEGGSDAEAGQFAHMGAVGWNSSEGTWIFKCGASLISNTFMLSAAHCSRVKSNDPTVSDPVPKIVRLGGYSITDYDWNDMPATDVEIDRFISHPQYRSPRKYYDIALIKLKKRVRFEWMIHPACLQSSPTVETDFPPTVTGWGVIDIATLRTTPILQVAQIDLVTSDDCDTKLRFGYNRNWRGVNNHQICAGYMAGGIDACLGDSGGPIQVKLNYTQSSENSLWYIHRVIGVTSFGYGCARANTPGVYTRVSSFIDWIEENVWPESSNLNSSYSALD